MNQWPSGRVSASAYCDCWFDLISPEFIPELIYVYITFFGLSYDFPVTTDFSHLDFSKLTSLVQVNIYDGIDL